MLEEGESNDGTKNNKLRWCKTAPIPVEAPVISAVPWGFVVIVSFGCLKIDS
jgi:hypothetical protein